MKITLSEHEASTITNGLRVAAERFDEDAERIRQEFRKGLARGWQSIVDQFERQARESRALADRIDEEGE